MQTDELDTVLDPEYLAGLEERPLDEVRAMRAECVRIGDALSYVRRLVQGRIDLLEMERHRRTEGGDVDDLDALVARLAGTLADRARPEGVGRLPERVTPPEGHGAFSSALDELVAGVAGRLPDVTDGELDAVIHDLAVFERDVSDQRRQVFERVDRLQAELTRRYRDGEATVDGLLS